MAVAVLPVESASLSGMGNPRVPVTRSGTGMGTNLYPSAGMGFLTGVFFLRGHGFGLVVPSGYIPVAILRCGVVASVVMALLAHYWWFASCPVERRFTMAFVIVFVILEASFLEQVAAPGH